MGLYEIDLFMYNCVFGRSFCDAALVFVNFL